MNDKRNRRVLGWFAAGALAWGVAACGGNTTSSLCADNGVKVTIVGNHPSGSHRLTVPLSDIAAGVDVTYDIQGSNTGHGHFVTLTAANFTALNAGTTVTLTSSDLGAAGNDHTHDVILSCAP